MYIYTIIAIYAIGISGLTRFYFIIPELRYSFEAFILTILCIFADYMVISGLLAAKKSDPGYLIPQETASSSTDKELLQKSEEDCSTVLCRKCSYPKSHIRVNHCSRCDRCVNYMDHHCLFIDNCVAKDNLAFYF